MQTIGAKTEHGISFTGKVESAPLSDDQEVPEEASCNGVKNDLPNKKPLDLVFLFLFPSQVFCIINRKMFSKSPNSHAARITYSHYNSVQAAVAVVGRFSLTEIKLIIPI